MKSPRQKYLLPSLQSLGIRLIQQLEAPLEGMTAHGRMAPSSHPGRKTGVYTGPGRPSSILILLFPDKDLGISTVFIRRTEYKGVHSGQISFPGGKAEPEDINLQHTALRETEEEIGIPAKDISILGNLSPLFIPPSKFLVSPYIGTLPYTPNFAAEPKEVAEIIPIKLEELLKPHAISRMQIFLPEVGPIHVPCYAIQGVEIWGATAMILSEFLELTRKALDASLKSS